MMVKSRRFWSSSNEPFSTAGLRESGEYDSFRAPTNSSSMSPNLNIAVPKRLKTVTAGLPGTRFATCFASSMPSPSVTISMSFDGRLSSKSRTNPPMTYAVVPCSAATVFTISKIGCFKNSFTSVLLPNFDDLVVAKNFSDLQNYI